MSVITLCYYQQGLSKNAPGDFNRPQVHNAKYLNKRFKLGQKQCFILPRWNQMCALVEACAARGERKFD